MQTCKVCNESIVRGSTAWGGYADTCLICQVEESLVDWRFTPKPTANRAAINRRYRARQKAAAYETLLRSRQ